MAKEWADMTPDERQEALIAQWMAPKDPAGNDLKFKSPQAEKDYKYRITLIKDALQMKKLPDRVPVFLAPSFYPAYHAGMTPYDVMYDYDKCVKAFKDFVFEFQPDGNLGAAVPGPGRFFEMLDYKLYSWPGHGVAKEQSYQANEGEYMKADEYDDLIDDPSNYFTHTYLPRVFGKLEGFQMLPALTGIVEMYGVAGNFIPFALPPVQATYKALFEAGAEALKWGMAMGAFSAESIGGGFPVIASGFTKAPFDFVGDTLRGTRGVMLDMYRCPDKLQEAMDRITPLMIKMGVGTAMMNKHPIIFIPLHKGADGFLSDEQFKKFYWPTFRKVMLGLIEQGVVPMPAAEGSWTTRLEVMSDLPKGKTLWMIDNSDIFKAKKTLGKVACLFGNVQSDLLVLGTPQQVKDYVKKIIDECAPGGGFIVSNGAFFDQAKAENVKAMIEFGKEYGSKAYK
ncbi:MAG: uroporphyrinogen decarboxylase family protein [Dehalococcoidia bacterium]|jgi:uroporphyrinogen-III decarboxylase